MIRNIFCVLVAIVWTVAMFFFAMASMLFTLRASASMYVVQRWWSPVLVWAGGGRIEVLGRENIDPKRPTIYVSNHQSTIDIPVLFISLAVDLRFVAKHQLKYVPFLGWYMSIADYIFVDRSNHGRAVASLKAAGELMKKKGLSVTVFPEGTRSDDGAVLPFKKGPFALAVSSGITVCPVAIQGTGALMPKNSWNITPGPLRVKVGAPIDPRQFGNDREALMKKVRDEVITLNLELGGKGGDRDDTVAARGEEGVGRRHQEST